VAIEITTRVDCLNGDDPVSQKPDPDSPALVPAARYATANTKSSCRPSHQTKYASFAVAAIFDQEVLKLLGHQLRLRKSLGGPQSPVLQADLDGAHQIALGTP
jgi:hypothetical protein